MIDKTRLRKLARLRAKGSKVLSLYLDLNPSEFATGRTRSIEVQSLLDQLERDLRADDGLDHEQRRRLKSDIERVRVYFDGEFSAKGARSVAVFCSEALELFEVIKLMRGVSSEAIVDDAPFIEPLLSYPGEDGYSVLVVNRKSARVLKGGAEGLSEVLTIKDDVHRWHGKGGWSQARFQRGIEKETHDHLKRAADVVFTLFKRDQILRLVVCVPASLKAEIEQELHPYLLERIAGQLDVDLEHATVDEVFITVGPVIEEDEKLLERERLDRLQAEVGGRGRGVTGLSDTLGVLNEKRVDLLIVQSGFRDSGALCDECGFLAGNDGSCPVDGSDMHEQEDIIEAAVESALGQSAEVAFIRHHDDLVSLGSVGAVLRY